MPTKIVMPQLGESVVEGTVNKWLKQVGDSVTEYEPLLEISTDKVDTEVPAPASGILLQILVPAGQTVERGVLLALIGDPNEVEAPHPTTHPEIVSTNGIESVSVANRISPVVARMAAEHRIDLNQISGTGLGGRVTKKDVDTYLAQPPAATPKTSDLPPWEQPVEGDLFKPTGEIFAKARQSLTPTLAPTPAPATSQMPVGKVGTRAMPPTAQNIAPITTAAPSDNGANGGAANGDEVMPLSPMRRAIAEHMVRSKLDTSPHVTTVFEVDMSAIVAHQQPARQARPDLMEAHARGRGRELRHQHGDVLVDRASQRGAARELGAKRDLADAQGAAFALHHGVQGRRRHAQGEMRPEHAFAPDHADLDTGAPRHDRDQRDESVDRKVEVARRCRRRADDLSQHHDGRFTEGEESAAVCTGDVLDQTVLCRQADPGEEG